MNVRLGVKWGRVGGLLENAPSLQHRFAAYAFPPPLREPQKDVAYACRGGCIRCRFDNQQPVELREGHLEE